MAEKEYFLDSTEENEHIYQAADFARFHHQIIGNGVSNTANLADLAVEAKNNMNVSLGAGYMFANGNMYENTEGLTLTHDTADSNNDRIDRVIICFSTDPEEYRFKATIKKGTPSNNPVAPALIRNNYKYQMSVAQVRIIAGKSFIEQSQITDERVNDAVCGYIPLHNIYRGLEVNELGMVTMPNQSYVEMNNRSNYILDGDETIEEGYSDYFYEYYEISAVLDRQSEVENGNFVVKESGTYLFSAHVRRLGGQDFENRKKLELFLVINGGEGVNDRLYLFNEYMEETQFNGSNIKYLEKGDVVQTVFSRRYTNPVKLDYVRLNIAKLN